MRRGRWQEQEWRAGWESSSLDLAPLPDEEPSGGEVTTQINVGVPGKAVTGADEWGAERLDAGPGAAPIKTSFARAWTPPEPEAGDGREMVAHFRRAAVALALSADEGSAVTEHARECAAALISLASTDREDLLAPVLRADPHRTDVTWTVACYQIGDLSPSTLRDFADASSAVRILAGCGEAAHVAAELIVTNGDGVRWTALVRSGADVTFQLLEAGTASASSAAVLMDVRHRWEDQLIDWAARPTAGLEAPAVAAAPEVPAVAGAAGSGDAVAVGMALGQLLESVRRIEQRLPPVAGGAVPQGTVVAPLACEAGPVRSSSDDLQRRVEILEREVAELRRELVASARRMGVLEAALGPSPGRPAGPPVEGLLVAGGPAAQSLPRSGVPGRVTWSR